MTSCRMTRARPAPSATRTAISRRRADARASSTPATFAQAMTSTTETSSVSSPRNAAAISEPSRNRRRSLDAPLERGRGRLVPQWAQSERRSRIPWQRWTQSADSRTMPRPS